MSPSTEPFNKAKFEALMDGHECSEIFISQLNEEFRFDAEYYRPRYLKLESILKHEEDLGSIVEMHDVTSNGSFKYVQDTLNIEGEETIPYIRSGNVGKMFLNTNELTSISRKAHNLLPLSQVQLHDVMMARKGKIGGASIITEKEVGYNCNENVVRLTIIDKKKYNPFYVATFFNCKYGLEQVERFSTGNVQPWLSMLQLRKLKCKKFSISFQNKIQDAVEIAQLINDKAEVRYKQTEELLLNEIKIDMSDFESGGVSIKSFVKSFGETGRLDAEYYQPKYDKIYGAILKMNHQKLRKIVDINKSIEPGSDAYRTEGIPFIRISDINKFGISEPNKYLEIGGEYDNPELYLKKDEILFSKDGSVGIAYKVEEDRKIISSSALLHLEVKDKAEVLPDYLTTVLNSEIIQVQAERDAGGSIIKHWKQKEIEEVLVPILDMKSQKEIATKARESFGLRKQSWRLLECAIHAVEMAIEEGEPTAIKWIDKKIAELTR